MSDAKLKLLTVESRKQLRDEQYDQLGSQFARVFPAFVRPATSIDSQSHVKGTDYALRITIPRGINIQVCYGVEH